MIRNTDTTQSNQDQKPVLRGMTAPFEGKVALITGGASGIGLATAKAFARDGAKVVIVDLSQERIDRALAQLHQEGGTAFGVIADVSKETDVKAMVERAIHEFGGLDVAVNNAGIGGPAAPIEDYPTDGWQKVLDINLTGVFLGMKHQLPAIQARGGGAIVNVASILGFAGFATSSAYVAAKHGVIGLTRNAALEYAAKGVRVNAVAPGFIETPLIEEAGIKKGTDIHHYLVAQHPIGRLGTSEEIAEAIVWLASDSAKFVNGHALVADGGYLAR